jgi:hypothetical protein
MARGCYCGGVQGSPEVKGVDPKLEGVTTLIGELY